MANYACFNKGLSTFLVLSITAIYHNASAQRYPNYYTGAQISELCINNSAECSTYVAAVADYRWNAGIDGIANNSKHNDSDACIPMNYPLKKMVADVRNYIIAHPIEKNNPSGEQVVEQALRNSYSCL